MLRAKEIENLTKEFEVSKEVVERGVLKIATTWESIIFSPNSVEIAREIILKIKKAMENFYPEPLSVVEKSDEIKYYLSLKVPHRSVPKQEVVIKSTNDRHHENSLENIKKRLKDLKDLYEEGIITEEEYEQKKKELLSKL